LDRLGSGKTVVTSQQALPEEIGTWLTALLRLQRVPFAYLVPDERLLPPESLRCFFLDDDWVRAALDGALAAATPTAAEREALRRQYGTVLGQLGLGTPEDGQTPGPRSGFLLRSRLLVRWPGVRIDATAEVLRRELLTPTTLFVLFEGVPEAFSLVEPAGETTLAVRRSGNGFTLLRSEFPGDPPVVPPRPGAAPGVLDWSRTRTSSPGRLAANLLDGLSLVRFEGNDGTVADDVFHPTAQEDGTA
jgi:hypothetical protein